VLRGQCPGASGLRASTLARVEGLVIGIDASLLAGRFTGDRTYWRHLIRALTALRIGHSYILYTPEPIVGFECAGDTVEMRVVPARNRRWWSMVVLPAAARRDGVCLLHSQYTISPLLRVTAVTTVHDVSFLIGPEWFRPRDRLLLRLSVPASIHRAAKVLTVSETSRADIERLIPSARGKTVATPLGTPDGFRRIAEASSIVQQRFGLSQPYALAVGTRQPRKNLPMLVRAFEQAVAKHGLPHKLALVGKSGWGPLVEGPHVRDLGYVPDEALPALYSGADAFFFPSLYEGFGLPVLEAMACGCPVVCSDGGALPEVAGDAAWVVSAADEGAWADAIGRVLDSPDLREELAAKGAERARMFSWRDTAERTAEVYREVAKWSPRNF